LGWGQIPLNLPFKRERLEKDTSPDYYEGLEDPMVEKRSGAGSLPKGEIREGV
jgi:hypothetical protein